MTTPTWVPPTSTATAYAKAINHAYSATPHAGVLATEVHQHVTLDMGDDVVWAHGDGPPIDGVTGAGVQGKGSVYIDRSTPGMWQNCGTKAVPVWLQFEFVAGSAGSSGS